MYQARDTMVALRPADDDAGLLELAVVVPVFNERANVAAMVTRLDAALVGIRWEAIFVDDSSPDGTADAVRAIAMVDPRVRVIERIGRRGLSSASIEGMCATAAPLVAVIDGDGQHDEALLPAMRAAFAADDTLDVAIGSRFVAGGGTGDWQRDRLAKSAFAARLSRHVLRAEVGDPMSGFFMVRTAIVRSLAPRLSGIGFKILLDMMTAAPRPLRFVELPYTFRCRDAGESKLDHVVAIEYLIALYDRLFGRIVPVRFVMFAGVGGVGVGIHMAILALVYAGFGTSFTAGQVVATLGALTFNFFLNNALTYRDRRLHGMRQLAVGWLSFAAVCGVGLAANVGVASYLHEVRHDWWVASAIVGILVGAVWNFALSSRFTWGRY